MTYRLNVSEREHLLKTLPLTLEQKDFLLHHVKRGKKTIFANYMAKDKGIVLPSHATGEEIEHLLDEWILEDYIDNGFVNPETRCECGRPLRYQYIVRHKTTNEKRRFGIDHFEEHTNIPSSIVKDIINGFHTIDYELDELLIKISENWTLGNYIRYIPNEYNFPKNIKEHLELNVPLLDRQIELLKREIRLFNDAPPRTNEKIIESDIDSQRNEIQNQISFNFDTIESTFQEVSATLENLHKVNLSQSLEEHIFQFIKAGTSSARVICELLIKNDLVSKERYLTGKPKIYVKVCQYLDSLVEDGVIKSRTVMGTDDRLYKL